MKYSSLSLVACCVALIACGGSRPVTQTASSTPEPAPQTTTPVIAQTSEDPSDVRVEGDHLVYDGFVNFDSNSSQISADSSPLLDHIALFLAHHSAQIARVHVVGHTDEIGAHQVNLELSQQRASAVVEALRARGVSVEIDSHGAGEGETLCSEDTEECHERNRRVEFIIEAVASAS